MRVLAGRLERVERGLAARGGVHVWLPAAGELDDGRVRHVGTGEVMDRGGVDRRPGWHIVVAYVSGQDWRVP